MPTLARCSSKDYCKRRHHRNRAIFKAHRLGGRRARQRIPLYSDPTHGRGKSVNYRCPDLTCGNLSLCWTKRLKFQPTDDDDDDNNKKPSIGANSYSKLPFSPFGPFDNDLPRLLTLMTCLKVHSIIQSIYVHVLQLSAILAHRELKKSKIISRYAESPVYLKLKCDGQSTHRGLLRLSLKS